MGDKEDYLTSYRLFFENFAANVNPKDQLPVYASDYSITDAELPGDVIYWTIEYLREKSCPTTLMTPLLRIILDEVRIAAKKYPNDYGFNGETSVYKAICLMQAVIARVNAVCLRYLDNSRLDTLPPPPRTQKEFLTVSAAMRNSRRVMEDRHVEIGNLEALFDIETTEHTSFYAVYDGHAGASAAQYCAAHLHQYLVESPHFKNNLKNALLDAFLRTDAEFIRKSKVEHRVVGGSTAVVICIRGSRLVVAWAGDSLALVAQRMRVMQLVNPHKPGREDERSRIETLGGTVLYWGTWRVNGQLAVSRAIGDAQYKPYVTAHPELAALDLDGDEDFLVIACDGLWDVVSEDQVALAVYRQITTDPNDLKAVTKRLILQAKQDGSEDNISIIVVFLKDPRDIAAQNCPPMEFGLDNAVVNPPLRPFNVDGDKVTAVAEAAGGEDPGVSDSDSEDLGPETAVDVDADDGDVEMRNPAPPTPPAHAVEASHIDGNLVDNVAESGEESEDEWNYFKGEGEPEENPSEEADEVPRSETPCQDNSASESSSIEMNSSPLNPDAPVFVPGGVASSDVLLAESPRKPLPMEDIVIPDATQFETEAGGRPAELQDLDNCDHLNGHHNISIEGDTAHLNGNNKSEMDCFEFNVGIESDKIKDSSLIQDFERIQKDTTDFCDIEVFQTQSDTNPFGIESNDDLFERLKNKERDPMSMSFYQEKDDDTCERFSKLESQVDLNSVQPLPESDDEDIEINGDCQQVEDDKENIHPEKHTSLFSFTNNEVEPNNDILRFDDIDTTENNIVADEIVDCHIERNNLQNYSNVDFECNNQETFVQTDTPESNKLLFEQIPEIPDGKSSELGFTNDHLLDPSVSQDDVIEINQQESVIHFDANDEHLETFIEHSDIIKNNNEIISESLSTPQTSDKLTPEPKEAAEFDMLNSEEIANNVIVDVHQSEKDLDEFETTDTKFASEFDNHEVDLKTSNITLDSGAVQVQDILSTKSPTPVDFVSQFVQKSDQTTEANLLQEVLSPRQSPLPDYLISKSPFTSETASGDLIFGESPVPAESPLPPKSPLLREETHSPILSEDVPLVPAEVPLPRESPAPSESPLPEEPVCRQSPVPIEESIFKPTEEVVQKDSLSVVESSAQEIEFSFQEFGPTGSPNPLVEAVLRESPHPIEESVESVTPLPVEISVPKESISIKDDITPRDSPVPVDDFESKVSFLPVEELGGFNYLEGVLQSESPVPVQKSAIDSPILDEQLLVASPLPETKDSKPEETHIESPRHSPLPVDDVKNDLLIHIVKEESPIESQTHLHELVPSIVTEEPEIAEIALDFDHKEVGDNAPAPDIVSQHTLADLVNNIDIPESRAQEICVPVTSEIPNQVEEIRPATTPPPTPAIELTEPPLSEVPIAAPVEPLGATVVAGAVVAAAATAAAAASAKTPTKKSSTGPTARPKSASKTPIPAKTPMSATKRPTSTTTTPRATSTKLAAPKTPLAKTAKPSPKLPSPTKAAPKPLIPAKEAAVAAKVAPRAAATRPASKPAAPKPPITTKTTTAAPKPPSTVPRVPTAKPAPRSAAAKTALPATKTSAPAPKTVSVTAKTATKTTTTTKTTAAAAKPKAPEKKPLTNGDVKQTAKPLPKPAAPAARPAARSATRQPTAVPAKPAAAKPAVAARAQLDKQSKDLANKRITATSAPPRTATAKSTVASKTAVKSVPKKIDTSKAGIVENGINGSADEVSKPPSSPPIDNALLPDVIA